VLVKKYQGGVALNLNSQLLANQGHCPNLFPILFFCILTHDFHKTITKV
jgi:hypothetical protein